MLNSFFKETISLFKEQLGEEFKSGRQIWQMTLLVAKGQGPMCVCRELFGDLKVGSRQEST